MKLQRVYFESVTGKLIGALSNKVMGGTKEQPIVLERKIEKNDSLKLWYCFENGNIFTQRDKHIAVHFLPEFTDGELPRICFFEGEQEIIELEALFAKEEKKKKK